MDILLAFFIHAFLFDLEFSVQDMDPENRLAVECAVIFDTVCGFDRKYACLILTGQQAAMVDD